MVTTSRVQGVIYTDTPLHTPFFPFFPSYTGCNTRFPLPSPFLLMLDVLPSPFSLSFSCVLLPSGHRPSTSPVPFISGHLAWEVSPPSPSHTPMVCPCTPQALLVMPTSCFGPPSTLTSQCPTSVFRHVVSMFPSSHSFPFSLSYMLPYPSLPKE